MNPDEMLEQLSHMLRGPLSTMRHVDFLQSEATYWRAEAKRLQDALTALRQVAYTASTTPVCPPEPPVGTEYLDGAGDRAWFRGDLGWYWSEADDPGRAVPWSEAYPNTHNLRRALPGVTA